MYPLHADSVGGMGSPGECFQDLVDRPSILDPAVFLVGVNLRNGGNQCLGVGVKRGVQYLRRLAKFNNLAEIHDSDIITHMLNNGEIMGDENVRQGPAAS